MSTFPKWLQNPASFLCPTRPHPRAPRVASAYGDNHASRYTLCVVDSPDSHPGGAGGRYCWHDAGGGVQQAIWQQIDALARRPAGDQPGFVRVVNDLERKGVIESPAMLLQQPAVLAGGGFGQN